MPPDPAFAGSGENDSFPVYTRSSAGPKRTPVARSRMTSARISGGTARFSQGARQGRIRIALQARVQQGGMTKRTGRRVGGENPTFILSSPTRQPCHSGSGAELAAESPCAAQREHSPAQLAPGRKQFVPLPCGASAHASLRRGILHFVQDDRNGAFGRAARMTSYNVLLRNRTMAR